MAVLKICVLLSEAEARALKAFMETQTGVRHTDLQSAIKKANRALAGTLNARPDVDKTGDMWAKKGPDKRHVEGSPIFVARVDRTADGDVLHFPSGLSGMRADLEELGWKRHRKS